MPPTPESKRTPLALSRIKLKGKAKVSGTPSSAKQSPGSSTSKTKSGNGIKSVKTEKGHEDKDKDDKDRDDETDEDIDETEEDEDDDEDDSNEEEEEDLDEDINDEQGDEDDLDEEDEVDEDDLDEEDEVDENDLDEEDEVDEDDLDEEDEVDEEELDEDDLDEDDLDEENEDYDDEDEDEDGVEGESKVDQSAKKPSKRKSKNADEDDDGHGIVTEEQAKEFRTQLHSEIKDTAIIDTLVGNYKEGLILDPMSYDSFLCNLVGMHRLTAEDQTVIAKIRADQLTVRDDEGHILTKMRFSARLSGGFYCNLCAISYGPREIASYCCDACDYDLCERCYKMHAAEVKRKVAKLEDEARQKSGKWRPSKDVLVLPAKAEKCWKDLLAMHESYERMDEKETKDVANLCRIIWQFDISNGKPLSSERAEMLLGAMPAVEHLPSYVAEAVCGLLSTCSKATSDALADKILVFAEDCLAAFPDSDFVAEEALQLIIMFERDEQKLLSRLAHLTKVRSGWV